MIGPTTGGHVGVHVPSAAHANVTPVTRGAHPRYTGGGSGRCDSGRAPGQAARAPRSRTGRPAAGAAVRQGSGALVVPGRAVGTARAARGAGRTAVGGLPRGG